MRANHPSVIKYLCVFEKFEELNDFNILKKWYRSKLTLVINWIFLP